MKVLVVDEALPVPPDSGKRIRTFELLRRLAKDHELLLVAPEERPTPAADLATLHDAGIRTRTVRRRPLVKRGARFAWDLGRNLLHRVPYMVMGHRVAAVRAAIAEEVAREAPDVVHVEWTPLVANLPAWLSIPVVVSAHNVEADIWARTAEATRGALRRLYVRIQLGKVARFERRALAAADAVTAVSEGDAARIRERTGNPHVVVVPNGVDGERFRPDPGARVDPTELLFLGSLDWRPNQDGVLWFLEHVVPAVRARVPSVTLSVVGRAPPPWFAARVGAVAGVAVHGSVPDVRPFLARAAVCVVPLRVGGGSRLKICEALAMARPVVSTTVGAEGLELGDGIVVADGAEPFADAVVRTLSDPAGAAEAARRGRARVLAANEWGAIAPIQARVWADAVARGARAP